jgi:hypothetical protein
MTGSSARIGQAAAHARDAVAHLGGGGVRVLGELEAHRDLALLGARDEVMMSTPSMPAMESSSGLVTCDSMTSDDAPSSRVLTLTSGSSMRGYSRT